MFAEERVWPFFGVCVLIFLSYLIFVPPYMNTLVPMPLHLVLMYWFISYWMILVMPIFYLFQLVIFLMKDKLGIAVLAMTIFFTVLNVAYFINAWSYGIEYQGKLHTVVVALENIVGFLIVYGLIFLGTTKKSRNYLYASNLLLFVLLTWCAFPYLGEMP